MHSPSLLHLNNSVLKPLGGLEKDWSLCRGVAWCGVSEPEAGDRSIVGEARQPGAVNQGPKRAMCPNGIAAWHGESEPEQSVERASSHVGSSAHKSACQAQ